MVINTLFFALMTPIYALLVSPPSSSTPPELDEQREVVADTDRAKLKGLLEEIRAKRADGQHSRAWLLLEQADPLARKSMDVESIVALQLEHAALERDAANYEFALSVAYDALRTVTKSNSFPPSRVGDVLILISRIYLKGGHIDAAIIKHREAIQMKAYALGKHHPDVVEARCAFSEVLTKSGELGAALDVATNSVVDARNAFTQSDVRLADCILGLAQVQHLRGRFTDAELLYEEARSNYEMSASNGTFGVFETTIRMGMMYVEHGEEHRARACLDEARARIRTFMRVNYADTIEIKVKMLALMLSLDFDITRVDFEVLFGDSSSAAFSGATGDDAFEAIELAALDLCAAGRCERAKSIVKQVLSSKLQRYGERHVSVASARERLSSILLTQDNLLDAAFQAELAAQTFEATLASWHPRAIQARRNAAKLDWLSGRTRATYQALLSVAHAELEHMKRLSLLGVTTRGLDVTEDYGTTIDGLLTETFERSRQGPIDEKTAEIVLNRKLRVLEVMSNNQARLNRCLKDHDNGDGLARALRENQRDFASLALSWRDNSDNQEKAELLTSKAERIWRSIHDLCGADWPDTHVALEQIQAALPDKGVLLEFIDYNPWRRILYEFQEGPRRYAVLVVSRSSIEWFDLGPADALDDEIMELRRSMILGSKTNASKNLYRTLVRDPMRAQDDIDVVYVAPDGRLGALPFAALQDEDGQFLIERSSVRYVMAGRELVRGPSSPAADIGVIVSDPTEAGLPGAATEARAVEEILGNDRFVSLSGPTATEDAIMAHERPWLVHFGVHGKSTQDSLSISGPMAVFDLLPEVSSPMLGSWLEVSPTSETTGAASDGRLTAYEISGWDLRGTQLAVLASCNSGMSDSWSFEEAVGLQRAFALAGARTQVLSLWSVGDGATAELMRDYYRRLSRGEGTATALRNVQLEWLATDARRLPRTWAAFVAYGDDESLVVPPSPCPPKLSGGCSRRSPNKDVCQSLVVLMAIGGRRRRARGHRSRPKVASFSSSRGTTRCTRLPSSDAAIPIRSTSSHATSITPDSTGP